MHLPRAIRCWLLLVVVAGGRLSALGAVPIVTEGKPAAAIVLPAAPTQVARYAAEELAMHVRVATGATLPIVAEGAALPAGQTLIYLGPTKTAAARGIAPQRDVPESFVVKTEGGGLYILGVDGGGDPLDSETPAGTLWGVYEWLEKVVKVRWLWPGKLGTYVPPVQALAAEGAEGTGAPAFFQRHLRSGLNDVSEHPALGFTKAALAAYTREQTVYLRRQRMGRSVHVSYGHAFTNWWERYGQQHPEWFQLRENGQRGPAKAKARFSMCVSSAGLQQALVDQWAARGGHYLNACENDYLGLCTCEACRAWDGPVPPDYLRFYSAKSKVAGAPFVSDRYAHFWLELQKRAAVQDPDATVIGYVYMNYFHAPTSGVKLNSHILLGYCPSGGWFPRSDDEQRWMKAQWDGWRATGARLFLRSNHLLDGYTMPYIFAHQFADDFQHAARSGMEATDLDSLTGQWATQGPNLYVAVRLHVRPEAAVDDLLAEYYGGFGAAAPVVKRYFDYWENYTTSNRERINRVMEENEASRWRTWAKVAHLLYPPECYGPGDALLVEAARAAAADPVATRRVEFLRAGLAHAKLCARVSSLLSLANPEKPTAEAKAALDEIIAFRRRTEAGGLGNYNHLAWVEDLSWKLSDEIKKAPELYP